MDKNTDKIRVGTAVVFVDNPFNIAKALLKKLVKRGVGYKYRNL
jgi:hypothetical protein